MLGMLICGTVLMFCGLWECCFKKPKTEIEAPVSQTQPTTVLIINPQEETIPSPPNYDELDQPPSYSILFPHVKVNEPSDSGNSVQETNSQTNSSEEQSQIDCDQITSCNQMQEDNIQSVNET